MRTKFVSFVMAFMFFAIPVIAYSPVQAEIQIPNNGPQSFADLAESLSPSVVNISSTQKVQEAHNMPDVPEFPPGSPFEDFFEEFMDKRGHNMPSVPPSSLGSGFIIDKEKGYVVTNNHVVKDADEVRVTFHDDSTVEAEVIGRDEKTDLAVLKVEITDQAVEEVPLGNSDKVRVGDWVMAIGNPFGLGGTVTVGIISARQRDINAGPYDDFLQTDASINRGNSGGPMFNLDGEVIGINTAIFSPSGGSVGIGFAIPSSLARPVIDQIIEFGHTRRGWLGVRIQTVTDEIAESLGLDRAKGALVASVSDKSPAGIAGIEAGDIILSFNGHPVDQMRHLPRLVAETRIDSTVKVDVWRNGKIKVVDVKIGELEVAEEEGLISGLEKKAPETETKGLHLPSVGLTLNTITEKLRNTYNLQEDSEGVLITKVDDNSEAAKKGLLPGNLLVEMNQKPVKTVQEAQDVLERAQKAGRSSVLLLIDYQGEGDVRFVALRLNKDKKD